jgi:hypothetical protein
MTTDNVIQINVGFESAQGLETGKDFESYHPEPPEKKEKPMVSKYYDVNMHIQPSWTLLVCEKHFLTNTHCSCSLAV